MAAGGQSQHHQHAAKIMSSLSGASDTQLSIQSYSVYDNPSAKGCKDAYRSIANY
jgi:hypothetical protein